MKVATQYTDRSELKNINWIIRTERTKHKEHQSTKIWSVDKGNYMKPAYYAKNKLFFHKGLGKFHVIIVNQI